MNKIRGPQFLVGIQLHDSNNKGCEYNYYVHPEEGRHVDDCLGYLDDMRENLTYAELNRDTLDVIILGSEPLRDCVLRVTPYYIAYSGGWDPYPEYDMEYDKIEVVKEEFDETLFVGVPVYSGGLDSEDEEWLFEGSSPKAPC